MRAHTPGPWHRNIKPASKYNIIFAGRNTHVAALQTPHGMSEAEIEANCNLIAAAPELLAALRMFRLIDFDFFTEHDELLLESVIKDADEAIAKALGK